MKYQGLTTTLMRRTSTLTCRTTTLTRRTTGLTRLGKSRTSLTKFKIDKTSWTFAKMPETCGTTRETSKTSCYDMVRRLTIARGRTKFSEILENLMRTVTTYDVVPILVRPWLVLGTTSGWTRETSGLTRLTMV